MDITPTGDDCPGHPQDTAVASLSDHSRQTTTTYPIWGKKERKKEPQDLCLSRPCDDSIEYGVTSLLSPGASKQDLIPSARGRNSRWCELTSSRLGGALRSADQKKKNKKKKECNNTPAGTMTILTISVVGFPIPDRVVPRSFTHPPRRTLQDMPHATIPSYSALARRQIG